MYLGALQAALTWKYKLIASEIMSHELLKFK